MDVGVDRGSHEACCGDGRGGKVICARKKGWYGSGGGHKLAHSRKSEQTIAVSTARAAGWGLRLGAKGERVGIVVYVCVWCREGARETNGWETNYPAHKVRLGGDVVGGMLECKMMDTVL